MRVAPTHAPHHRAVPLDSTIGGRHVDGLPQWVPFVPRLLAEQLRQLDSKHPHDEPQVQDRDVALAALDGTSRVLAPAFLEPLSGIATPAPFFRSPDHFFFGPASFSSRISSVISLSV